MEAIIRLEDVGKSYDGVTAVAGVSFAVGRGQICVLIGPSGCGKTTTLKMINLVIEPSAGRILVRGEDNRRLDPVALRRSIGYVIQQVGLFPHMTVEENVAVVLRLLGREPRARRARAAEMLDLVGLPPGEFLVRYPSQLSGGQQQRVGVARALAADPDIILMDEPFGAVDPLVRKQLQRELKRIQAAVHKTIVFVTHDLSEAFFLGDRLVLMNQGRIEQQGMPHDLLFAPASPFVSAFLAESREMAQLAFRRVGEIVEAAPTSASGVAHAAISADLSLLDAVRSLARQHAAGDGLDPTLALVKDGSGSTIGALRYCALMRAVGETVAEPAERG